MSTYPFAIMASIARSVSIRTFGLVDVYACTSSIVVMTSLHASCLHALTLKNCCSGKLYPGDLHSSVSTSCRASEHEGPLLNSFCIVETNNPTLLFFVYFGTLSKSSS